MVTVRRILTADGRLVRRSEELIVPQGAEDP